MSRDRDGLTQARIRSHSQNAKTLGLMEVSTQILLCRYHSKNGAQPINQGIDASVLGDGVERARSHARVSERSSLAGLIHQAPHPSPRSDGGRNT